MNQNKCCTIILTDLDNNTILFPTTLGGSKVIDLDQEVDNFHISNIKNGLAPSLAITTYTNANDEERMAIENMLRLQYEGTSNAGNMLYMDVADPSLKPDITPIPQNGATIIILR